MTSRRIDDCLSARDGRLVVEECDTLDLVREFGSPLFVFSEDQLRRNVRRFQAAFQAGWPDGPVVVMPAAKANWLAAIQRTPTASPVRAAAATSTRPASRPWRSMLAARRS